ncbi:MT-A70-domain-containing protein [Ceratobasidium sp. AG-I]|nr:MT-A70-domain-containing protein [Ceratobasidium sp. AG-I]
MKDGSNEPQQLGVEDPTPENDVLLPPSKRARKEKYTNYVPEEETIRNDYSQRYVDGGEWPQNWVLGARLEQRFEEYPKQRRLLELKRASVAAHAHPPTYLSTALLPTLVETQSKFDVILLDPPVSESNDPEKDFTWADVQAMPIPTLAAEPSFIFMWVGSGAGDGLERGREVLARWGFRRCEDVVWVKTNLGSGRGPGGDPPTTSLFTRTKQHCLMGIRGTVRRSTDNWFVHCNIDTDVIIWDGDPTDPTRKPPEMYSLIENFCLGTRKLEIFGKQSSLRKGWVTALSANVSPPNLKEGNETEPAAVPWDKATWEASAHRENGRFVVPSSQEIEILRPKSPQRGQPNNAQNAKPQFPGQFPQQPSPHPSNPNPNNMLGKPLHMGFQRHPQMAGRPGGMGPPDPSMGMGVGMPMGGQMSPPPGMGMPMGMGMNMNQMNQFGFNGGGGGANMGPGGMGQNGMMPNGMMGNMFGMGGGMPNQPMNPMMFNQNFAPGFDGGMGGQNMGFDQGGPGPQGWWDGTQRGPFQGGNMDAGGWQQRPDGMGQPMGVYMGNMMGNVQLPPGFDGNMNRGF